MLSSRQLSNVTRHYSPQNLSTNIPGNIGSPMRAGENASGHAPPPQMHSNVLRTTTPVSADSRTSIERRDDQASLSRAGVQTNTPSDGPEIPHANGGSNLQSRPAVINAVNVQPSPAPPQSASQTTPHQKSRFEKVSSHLLDMKSPISLVVVFAITVGMIYTSPSADAPLAKAGITSGFLILNILALANAYTFLAASDKVWERLQWGDVLKGGEDLTTFLALSSSTGLAGWTRMLFRRRKYDNAGHARTWSFLR